MKEIIIKGYTFNELNEEAKAKALETHNHILVEDGYWHEPVLEGFQEDMEAIGFANAKPSYSGFWSQGDGACFTCQTIDLAKVFEHMKSINYFDIPKSWISPAKKGSLTGSVIKQHHRYSHSNTIRACIDYSGSPKQLPGSELDQIETVLTDYARHLSDKLYADLETQYDAETTAEAVGTELEEREYLFTEEGKHIKFN